MGIFRKKRKEVVDSIGQLENNAAETCKLGARVGEWIKYLNLHGAAASEGRDKAANTVRRLNNVKVNFEEMDKTLTLNLNILERMNNNVNKILDSSVQMPANPEPVDTIGIYETNVAGLQATTTESLETVANVVENGIDSIDSNKDTVEGNLTRINQDIERTENIRESFDQEEKVTNTLKNVMAPFFMTQSSPPK